MLNQQSIAHPPAKQSCSTHSRCAFNQATRLLGNHIRDLIPRALQGEDPFLRNVMDRKLTAEQKKREERLLKESRNIWKKKDVAGEAEAAARQLDKELYAPQTRTRALRELPPFKGSMDEVDYLIKKDALGGSVKVLKQPRKHSSSVMGGGEA